MPIASANLKSVRVNPDWARLPLYDRTGWTKVRFGDVVENLSIPLYVAPGVDTVQEEPGRYGTGSLADALSAWLESSQQVRRALDALLEMETGRKKLRS
jgi:hypothetical protein